MVIMVNNTVLSTGKLLRELSEKFSCKVMDVNLYHGDHFTIYTYIESLGCIPKTNTVLYVNYISIKLEKC